MTVEEITSEFTKRKLRFEQLEAEARYILEAGLSRHHVKTHSTSSRVKELNSFLDKVKRKESDKPFDDINDIVGIRVVCLFLSDIPKIGSIVKESFEVISHDDKIEDVEVSSFGYMSLHYIVEMKKEYRGPRYDDIASMRFEIQLRTILMDAWANVSHYLDYKTDIDVPKTLRRDFYALSGLFYVADSHFELFFKSSKESKKETVELATRSAPQLASREVNLDTMTAYLTTRFPDRNHAPPKGVSELVQELITSGYATIEQVDKIVDAAAAAFAAYERAHPPSPGPRYSDVGVVRVSISFVNEDFNRRRMKGARSSEMDPYRKLIKKISQ